MATDEVNFHAEGAWFVEHFRLEVLNEHAPTKEALRTKVGVDQVLMISINASGVAPESNRVLKKKRPSWSLILRAQWRSFEEPSQ